MLEARLADFDALIMASLASETKERALDVVTLHARYGDFVWATLARLGVRPSDLEDQLQEVFVVVHRRVETYDGSAPMSAWLYGVSRRVAAAYRRRRYMQKEVTGEPPVEVEDEGADPEQVASLQQARGVLHALLDGLDLDKRAVFVMFELEGMDCEEIAGTMGVPVGTVYSRLHVARKEFQAALARHRKRQSFGGRSR